MSSDLDLVRIYPPSVILEDDPIHLPPYYFCATDDPTCPCREDPNLVTVIVQEYHAGVLTGDEALRIVQGRQVNS
ncbi:MAG: hypothetical protein WCD86_15600 [Ktedonobacteraceae bacterium]